MSDLILEVSDLVILRGLVLLGLLDGELVVLQFLLDAVQLLLQLLLRLVQALAGLLLLGETVLGLLQVTGHRSEVRGQRSEVRLRQRGLVE